MQMWLTALRKEILETLSGPVVLEALAPVTQRLREGPGTQKTREKVALERFGAESEPTHGHWQIE